MSHSNRNRADKKLAEAEVLASQHEDHDYALLLSTIRSNFNAFASQQFYTTDIKKDALWQVYLNALPAELRQFYTCHACKAFFERYGGLVTIDEEGNQHSLFFNQEPPGLYTKVFQSLNALVLRAKVNGVFYSSDRLWGTPITGEWTHPAVKNPSVFSAKLGTPFQAMANAKENYKNISIALAEFSPEALDQMLRIFRAEAVARSEKFIAPTQWLRDLHDRPKNRQQKDNLLWRAVALAPEGFCHPRSSVLAPLLDAVKEGKSIEQIQRMFNTMLHGLRYQRPQVAPSEANVQRAEQIAEKLGIARSLERRFAKLEEVELFWKPTLPEQGEENTSSSVFASVKTKTNKNKSKISPIELNTQTKISWEKFEEKYLGSVHELSLYINVNQPLPFYALTTAQHNDAPIIHRWGHSFAWYTYHNGSFASNWLEAIRNRPRSDYIPVNGISLRPCHWNQREDSQYDPGLLFVLKDCRDSVINDLALFPETLIPELYPVRNVIEAFSKQGKVQGYVEASACGIGYTKGSSFHFNLKATLDSGEIQTFIIDRWE